MKKGFISLILGLLIAGSAVADVPEMLHYHLDLKMSVPLDYLTLKRYFELDKDINNCLDSDYTIITSRVFGHREGTVHYIATMKIQVSAQGTDIFFCDLRDVSIEHGYNYREASKLKIADEYFESFKKYADIQVEEIKECL